MSYLVFKDFDAVAPLEGTTVPPGDLNQTEQLQQLVYIIAGVLGGVCLILLIFTIYLCATVSKLQKQFKGPSTKAKKGKTNEAADLTEVETRFSQYPPAQPQIERPQSVPYQNPADYPSYSGAGAASRYEQPIVGRQLGQPRIPPAAGQVPPQQQPRGLRNYDNYGY